MFLFSAMAAAGDHWRTEGSGKTARVALARCESMLPLTLSLSDSGNYFYPPARQRRAPNTILFSTFLFSDNAAPATNGRQARPLGEDGGA